MKYDVLVSGSGPAGSKCAETLARKGFNVALIEKDTNWRKPCGGAVSSRIFKYYPQLQKLNLPRISGLSIYSGDYQHIKASWKNTRELSINVDRLDFDNFIRNVAVDAGANLYDKNVSFDYLIKENKKIGIKTKTREGIKEYKGQVIIIADGMSSKLAPKSGLRAHWRINEIGLCKCSIMKGRNYLDKKTMSLFFRNYKGYAWIFPLDEDRFNIGCGTWLEDNLRYNINQVYQNFVNDPYLKKFFPGEEFEEIWTGAYPIPALGVKEKSLYKDNIMIIGDAAGFVSPISGEGIHPSVVSGKVAAETAIKALEKEDISDNTLKEYKSSSNIKKIIRNFKMKVSMTDFLFKNNGRNLSNMFKIAEFDGDFREMVINLFLFNQVPTREFFLKLKNTKM